MFRQGSFADHEYLTGTLQVDIGIVIASGTVAVVDDDTVELFAGYGLAESFTYLDGFDSGEY